MLVGVRRLVEIPLWENRYLNYLLHRIAPEFVTVPDSKWSFHYQWRRAARNVAIPDVIYSRSFPSSSALMALKLKKAFKVPWIMHLSDPWADSPLRRDSPRVRAKNQKLERACFENADVVCLTSQKTIDFYSKKYPGVRYELFPNVYDPEDRADSFEVPRNRKLRLVHTGALASIRSPETFLQALQGLPPEVQDELEVIFCGFADRGVLALFEKYRCKCFSFRGVLTAREVLELQRSADVLILIDFVAKGDLGMFFLSKILDYMLARKYILALTGLGSECEDVIQGRFGDCFEHDDISGIQAKIRDLIEVHKRDPGLFVRNLIDSRYDAALCAARLTELFREFSVL
ncbi:MAG: hypothetical protein KIS61_10210 [Candidatus Eremiobacteraeota bacterium]|nr:hypothetical protein [Candidatus Eremiobacteraeota bacterium]